MKPIKVQIQNFQSIENIEFTINGLTTLTGPTNIGKSAIIRAISGAILNNPVVNMVRHGATTTVVDLHSEDWGLQWKKAEKGTSQYTIDGKKEVLDSVGRGQIDEVRELGFKTVKIGENKYLNPWYANQYRPVFLLDESGPAITDFISEVSRLNVLQDGIVFLNREKKRFKDKVKFLEEEVGVLQKKRDKLTRLEEMQTLQEELKLQFISIMEYEQKINFAEKLFQASRRLQSSIGVLSAIEVVKPVVPDFSDFGTLVRIQKFQATLKYSASKVIALKTASKIVIPGKPDFDDLEILKKATALLNGVQKLSRSINKLDKEMPLPVPSDTIPADLSRIKVVLNQINRTNAEIKEFSSKNKTLTSKLEEVRKQLKKIPVCPTCDRPVGHTHAEGGGGGIVLEF